MYTFKANITITQGRPAGSKAEKSLQDAAHTWIYPLLDCFHIDYESSFSYDHPEERFEMMGIDFVTLNIRAVRECHRLHTVVCLSQILQSATALYDGLTDTRLTCQILENCD